MLDYIFNENWNTNFKLWLVLLYGILLYNSVVLYNLIIILFYSDTSKPIEFVTLKDRSEGLIIGTYSDSGKEYSCKFIDPFLPIDASDITNVIIPSETTDTISYCEQFMIITKSNRKFSVIENKVHVTNGLKENTFQQMLKNTYHSNIYTLSIFKTIQEMLKDIIENGHCDFPDDNKIELKDERLLQFKLEKKRST